MTLFNTDKVEYNSFNTANSRRRAFIVRGICYHDYQDGINAISSALAALHIHGRVDVSLFETAYLRHHPNAKRSPLFRIVVGNNVNSQLILDMADSWPIWCARRIDEKVTNGSVSQLPAIPPFIKSMPFSMYVTTCLG